MWEAGAGLPGHLGKDGSESGFAFGSFGHEGGFGGVWLEEESPGEERQQSVVVALPIIGDARVVMALGAGQIHAEKEACGVAGEGIGFGLAIENPASGAARWGVGVLDALGGEKLLHELVPGGVGCHFLAQPCSPFGYFDVFFWSSFHEHNIQHVGEMALVVWIGDEGVDEESAFMRSGIGQKGLNFRG